MAQIWGPGYMGMWNTICNIFAVEFLVFVGLSYKKLYDKSTTNQRKWSLGLCDRNRRFYLAKRLRVFGRPGSCSINTLRCW